jgi:ADP-ribose pyrophosphatase YjhB (NUDIX family)
LNPRPSACEADVRTAELPALSRSNAMVYLTEIHKVPRLNYNLGELDSVAAERVFTRFSKTSAPPRINEIPEGGFCISSFVVLSKKGRPQEVLLGKLDKTADWERIGGLDKDRAESSSRGWMLPGSHLLYGESPHDAAKRILTEMLGISDQKLQGPAVFSEVYGPKNHWDIEFVFTGERDESKPHTAWKELKFLDTTKLRESDFARNHQDVLAHVGKWKS